MSFCAGLRLFHADSVEAAKDFCFNRIGIFYLRRRNDHEKDWTDKF